MSNEFDSMFSDLQKSRATESMKMRQEHEDSIAQAKADFDLKAQPLIDQVLPALKDAQESFARQGLVLVIDEDLQAKADARHKDPAIKFFFKKPERSTSAFRLDDNVSYYFAVTHTQGGVKCGRQFHGSATGRASEDLSKKFGVGNAQDLDRDTLVKFIEFALSDATL